MACDNNGSPAHNSTGWEVLQGFYWSSTGFYWEVPGFQVVRAQTGGAQSTRTC